MPRKPRSDSSKWTAKLDEQRVQEALDDALVDAYGDYEQHSGLLTMIEDQLRFPFQAKLLERCFNDPLEVPLKVWSEVIPMAKVPEIIPVTDLRQDAAAALKRVRNSKQPVVITQRGRAVAIMLSVEAYERGEHERELLKLLVRGDKEIAAGKGYDLNGVLGEADAILSEDSG